MRGRIIAGSCGLAVSAGWNITNIGPIADVESSAYGVGLVTVGLFTATLFLGHLLAQIPSGRAIDLLDARRVGLVALLWIAACNTVLLVAPDPALALCIRGLVGLGTGAVFVAGSDLTRWSSPSAPSSASCSRNRAARSSCHRPSSPRSVSVGSTGRCCCRDS